MFNVSRVTDDIFFIGGNDRRLALFENVYPIPKGVSYNSYFISDEKTVLLDTADKAVSEQFLENLKHVLGGRALDYLVVNHMEPDHCAVIGEIIQRYPETKIVGTSKTLVLIGQFYGTDVSDRFITVSDGSTLETGKHTLNFFTAPMVHWPEVMVSYDSYSKILFSADAFGTFGALSGNIFDDNPSYLTDIMEESRRYYTNIVGKYGNNVQVLLRKASGLDISMICPLHGPVRRDTIGDLLNKYAKWSAYEPEDKAVLVLYASIYGHTAEAAEILAAKLGELGVKDVSVYDTSAIHPSYLLSEAFRCSHIVFASSTYNLEIFDSMETVLRDMKNHNLKNRSVAIMENGSWAPTAGKLMKEMLESMKGITFIGEPVTVRSAVDGDSLGKICALAEEIAKTV